MAIRECNECGVPSAVRVELRTPSQRSVVCGACAVAIAAKCAQLHQSCTVLPMIPPMVSLFVASDESYYPNALDAVEHQRELDQAARRFAQRVHAVIVQRVDWARSVA